MAAAAELDLAIRQIDKLLSKLQANNPQCRAAEAKSKQPAGAVF